MDRALRAVNPDQAAVEASHRRAALNCARHRPAFSTRTPQIPGDPRYSPRQGGLAKDAQFDMEGFKNTLRLRAEFEGGDTSLTPDKISPITSARSRV
jgi:hypothetical protein